MIRAWNDNSTNINNLKKIQSFFGESLGYWPIKKSAFSLISLVRFQGSYYGSKERNDNAWNLILGHIW